MKTDTILNIVVAGIRRDEQWLLIKRQKGDYQSKWALVGGKMEYGETIEHAIIREIKEETGLSVKFQGIKSLINERLVDKKSSKQTKHFLIILCETSTKNSNFQVSNEGKLKWFSGEELKKMKDDIIPSDYLMIKKLIKLKDGEKDHVK